MADRALPVPNGPAGVYGDRIWYDLLVNDHQVSRPADHARQNHIPLGLYHACDLSHEHGDQREVTPGHVAQSCHAGHGGDQVFLARTGTILLALARIQHRFYGHTPHVWSYDV